MFEYFFRISPLRQGEMGLMPIQPSTIRDWCEMSETELKPWEREAIIYADLLYRAKIQEMQKLHREADEIRARGRSNGHSDDRV